MAPTDARACGFLLSQAQRGRLAGHRQRAQVDGLAQVSRMVEVTGKTPVSRTRRNAPHCLGFQSLSLIHI
eukprot:6752015-Pyramimonas_sp.AAC.1